MRNRIIVGAVVVLACIAWLAVVTAPTYRCSFEGFVAVRPHGFLLGALAIECIGAVSALCWIVVVSRRRGVRCWPAIGSVLALLSAPFFLFELMCAAIGRPPITGPYTQCLDGPVVGWYEELSDR